MKTVFVDSNVFLRFFTHDDAGQAAKAEGLFRDASAGKAQLIAGPPVLFEVAWAMRAAYQQSREKVLEVLATILHMQGLRLVDRHLVEHALNLSATLAMDFADAYILASARQYEADQLATFNQKHFHKSGIALHPF